MVLMNSPLCVPREKLAQFATGKVSMDQLDVISAHVDTCISCQATVAELAEEPDSLVVALQTLPSQEQEPAEESICQLALEKLVEHRSLTGRPSVANAPMPPSIGAYRVLEPIGAGGMGVVYKAQHPKLKRTVAIKLLPLQHWAGSAAVARFEREMEVIGSLDHPNIVRASDAGDAGGTHYLVMDFIDGVDLSRLVHRMGPLPMTDACEIIRQAALGLEHVHAAGLVHRDIKPSNIMLTHDGHVKILDLGLAMLGQQYREGENNLTTIGQLMGTLDYMAPEQAADSRHIDSRADVYSLGATLFKLLTGQAPYGGPSHRSLLKKVLALANAPVPSLRELRPEIPEELDWIVGKCLAKDPDLRYASVGEVSRALAPFAATQDLRSLMEKARERTNRDLVDVGPWPLPALAAAADSPGPAAELKSQGAGRRVGWFAAALVATAGMALLALSAVVIRIATDRGELIVSSADPDARLLIKRTDGQSTREMTVEQGAGKITIKSGDYLVELLGDADMWSLSRNQFTIARGSQVVLQVERKEMAEQGGASAMGPSSEYSGGFPMDGSTGMMPGTSSMSMGSASGMTPGTGTAPPGMNSPDPGVGSPMPGTDTGGGMPGMGSTNAAMLGGVGPGVGGFSPGKIDSNEYQKLRLVYDGRTYYDWLTVVDTERNPTRLQEAVNAIRILVPENDAENAARALLRIMRAFGSQTIDGSSAQGNLIMQTLTTLRSLDPEGVVRACTDEMVQGNNNSREFLLLLLGNLRQHVQATGTRNPLVSSFAQAAPQMMSTLLEMSHDKDLELSRWALEFAGSLAVTVNLDDTAIEGFLPRFREALQSEDTESAYQAAVTLSYVAPDTEGIADVLVSHLQTPQGGEALASLARVGPHAPEAVAKLLRLSAEEGGGSSASSPGPGGMMGGGMGGVIDVQHALLWMLEENPSAAQLALPTLQKFADKQGPYQERARQLIERIQAAAAAQPAEDGKPPVRESGQ
ncbi:MAG: serine/threonine protein kinase [Pirellulaceae bacterium]